MVGQQTTKYLPSYKATPIDSRTYIRTRVYAHVVVSAVNYNVIARFHTQLRVWPYFVTLRKTPVTAFRTATAKISWWVINLPLAFKSFTKFSFPDILVLVVASHHYFHFESSEAGSHSTTCTHRVHKGVV